MQAQAGKAAPILALVGLVVVLALPFGLVDLPPMTDLPNHAARYYLETHAVPGVAGHYRISMRPLPNLLGDLIVMGLTPLIGFTAAVTALLILAALLPVFACIWLHRALFGGPHWWPLASGLFAFHGLYLMGFLNFSLGLGLAMGVTAFWIAVSATRPVAAILAFAPLALLAALAHAFGLLFLVLLVGCFEIERAWQGRADPRQAVLGLLRRGAALTVAALPALWLTAQAVVASQDSSVYDWGTWRERAAAFLTPFATYHERVDLATAALFCLLLLAVLLTGRLRIRLMTGLCLAVAAVLFLAVPQTTSFGPAVVAPRFAVFAAFLICAGARPDLSGRPAILAKSLVALLLATKLAVIGLAWRAWEPQLADLRRALQAVEPGSRVATVTVGRSAASRPYFEDQIARAMLSFTRFRADANLGALAVLDRGAVWPALFAYTGQQPLARIGPFAGHPIVMNPLPSRDILDADRAPGQWNPSLPAAKREDTESAWARWRQEFDYVLVIHAGAAADHDSFLPDRLALVRRDGFAALYRVLPP